jgi:hypothetical protein
MRSVGSPFEDRDWLRNFLEKENPLLKKPEN